MYKGIAGRRKTVNTKFVNFREELWEVFDDRSHWHLSLVRLSGAIKISYPKQASETYSQFVARLAAHS